MEPLISMCWRKRGRVRTNAAAPRHACAAPASGALGFLGRLRRDVAGNTLAIMGAALVPLIGFTGSAVDMARLYVVKVRLQQACDAGVLAGRHAMTDTAPATPLDATANTQAQQFFANNFQSGWFQAANPVFTPTKVVQGASLVANAVHGVATVTVPMAVMRYFGAPSVPLSVSCQALFELADTDVVFVLDTTGSMSCYPSDPDTCGNGPITSFQRTDGSTGYYDPEKSQTTDSAGNPMFSKIESLRQAVVTFDTTMRNNADTSTHFRYGFVPYSSSVNIGSEIRRASPALLQTSWTYQSRQVNRDYSWGNSSSFTLTNIPKANCYTQRYPGTANTYATTGPTWNTSYPEAMQYTVPGPSAWNNTNGGTCTGTQQPLRPVWRYQPYQVDTSQYVLGNAVTNPSRLDGSANKWRGCIEELNTSTGSSFDLSNLPDDLNPDVLPTSPANLWRPMWPDIVWQRNSTSAQDVNDDQVSEDIGNNIGYTPYGYGADYSYGAGHSADSHGFATCGMAAQRLSVMSHQDVQNYVYANDFRPFGGTYHDVGMIWGARMLSAKGVFANDTAAWAGRNPPSRVIVFMTDGAMAPNPLIYGQYGTEALDQRVTGSGDSGTDLTNHVARFRIECDAAKARGVSIYVVALGTSLNSDLQYCASSGQAFNATSTKQLTDAFTAIAKRVAKLRITQ